MSAPRKFWIIMTSLCLLTVQPAFSHEPPTSTAGSGDHAENPAEHLELTAEEHAWLRDNPVLKVGMDPHWPPFSIRKDSGEYTGIDPQMLHLLSQILDVEFQVMETGSWEQTHALLRAEGIDLALGTAQTPKREQLHNFTRPYLSTPVAVIMRQDAPFFVRLEDLTDQTAAAPRGYATTDYLRRTLPDLQIRETETVGEALDLVSRGQADFVLENLVTTSFLIRQRGFSNLKIAGIADEKFEQRIAVRQGAPMLAGILDKALETIPESRMSKILEEWIPVEVGDVAHWQKLRPWLWRLALVAGMLIALFAAWNFILTREIQRRRQVERALLETKTQLEALNAEKDRLMGMVAHDLNSPLTQVQLAAGMLHDHVPQEDADAQTLLDSLEHSAKRMSSLTRNLLSMHAAEQHPTPAAVTETTELKALVLDLIRRHRPSADLKHITLETQWDAQADYVVRASTDVCDQILDNLISNAIKFSPQNSTIILSLARAGNKMIFCVTDHGPGVKSEEMTRIFEKFVRCSARPTAGETSTGLGLSIVKHLVTLMGGEVHCESDGRTGSRFILTLPAAESAVKPQQKDRRQSTSIA